MSDRNDKAFAEYMVRLAKRMIEREDQQAAEREQINAFLSPQFPPQFSQQQFALNAVNYLTAGSQPATAQATITLAGNSRDPHLRRGEYTTKDEMAVIRAYFDDEDVITTILSQTR